MYRDQLTRLTSSVHNTVVYVRERTNTHTHTTLLFLNVSAGCSLLSDKADQRNANCIFSAARSGLVCWTSVSDDQLHPRGCTVIHMFVISRLSYKNVSIYITPLIIRLQP